MTPPLPPPPGTIHGTYIALSVIRSRALQLQAERGLAPVDAGIAAVLDYCIDAGLDVARLGEHLASVFIAGSKQDEQHR